MPDTASLWAQYRVYRRWFCWSFWSVTKLYVVSLSSASLAVWQRWSSSRLEYSHKYHTDMYRPLSEWSIPIIDRDRPLLISFNDLMYRYANIIGKGGLRGSLGGARHRGPCSFLCSAAVSGL